MTIISELPEVETDDGYAGSGYQSAAALKIGYEFGSYHSWIRYPTPAITLNADFSAATVTLDVISGSGTTLLRWYGVKEVAPTYPTDTTDYNARALTTAYVDDTITGTGTKVSPDLSAILEEIAAQAGHDDTKAIMLYAKDRDGGAGGFSNFINCRSYAYGTGLPVLDATFTAGAAPGQPIVKRLGGVAFSSGGYQPGSGVMRWRHRQSSGGVWLPENQIIKPTMKVAGY